MDLCIIDSVKRFGVTSKTLRCHERVGLLEAKRADNNKYRFYDEMQKLRWVRSRSGKNGSDLHFVDKIGLYQAIPNFLK